MKKQGPVRPSPSTRALRAKSQGSSRPDGVRGARAMYKKLVAAHPDAHCELDHDSPFQLIVATVLSAQALTCK